MRKQRKARLHPIPPVTGSAFLDAIQDMLKVLPANVVPIEMGRSIVVDNMEIRIRDHPITRMIRTVVRHFDDPEEQAAACARFQILVEAMSTFPIDRRWWEDKDNWSAAALAAATLPVDWSRRRFEADSFFHAIERFGRQVSFLST